MKRIALTGLLLSLAATVQLFAAEFPGKKKSFHGFDMYEDGRNRIVVPKTEAEGRPWVWRARFFGHRPEFDVAMLKKGYHIVYCDVAGLFGSPAGTTTTNYSPPNTSSPRSRFWKA